MKIKMFNSMKGAFFSETLLIFLASENEVRWREDGIRSPAWPSPFRWAQRETGARTDGEHSPPGLRCPNE